MLKHVSTAMEQIKIKLIINSREKYNEFRSITKQLSPDDILGFGAFWQKIQDSQQVPRVVHNVSETESGSSTI